MRSPETQALHITDLLPKKLSAMFLLLDYTALKGKECSSVLQLTLKQGVGEWGEQALTPCSVKNSSVTFDYPKLNYSQPFTSTDTAVSGRGLAMSGSA